MSTIYYVASSLDGFVADEHDGLDWLLSQDVDDTGPLGYASFIERVGALVMGSTTYGWICDHLGVHPDGLGGSWPYDVPSWVMTTRDLSAGDGADVRFARGDIRPVHAAMVAAAGDRDLWVVGGGALASAFATAGLLDEIVVAVAPVTLGAGRPLLPGRHDLELLEVARNRAFACARYAVRG
ncbi:dihydrofolate reductase family protein [Nocardioides flavescens]|uniref:Dihydrofolate reductase n=1 Tax=Nocardioides flavescens TaxID=2691959 RepID=A0A6L7F3S3_9ACTN|nr:dihydrofolate reductase family protein [Nocardioides flavescens]MXG91890.1 dihydrofolate reductase [Nocardioides flavescens]